MTDTVRSRLPNVDIHPDLAQFLEGIDRRQLRIGNLDDLDSGASLADVIAKINVILGLHRTR